MTRTPAARTRNSRAVAVLLVVGAWVSVSWLVLGHLDLAFAIMVDVALGLALVGLALLLRSEATANPRPLWTATAVVGLLLVLAPVAFRYSGDDRIVSAYVNSILAGLVVLGVSAWAARRAPAG